MASSASSCSGTLVDVYKINRFSNFMKVLSPASLRYVTLREMVVLGFLYCSTLQN